jgi:hypothetical protein
MALTQISTQGIKDGTITGTDLATNVDLVDNQKLRLGTGNDLQIYHDGTNSLISDTGNGYLKIDSNGSGIYLTKSDGESMASFITDGAVELFHNGTKKFETTSYGAAITSSGSSHGLKVFHSNGNEVASLTHGGSGDEGALILKDSNTATVAIRGEVGLDIDITTGGNFDLEHDSAKLRFGAGNDLEIYHDGSESLISNANSGVNLVLKSAASAVIKHDTETMAQFIGDGAVELYHDNSKKLETTSNGATVTGNLFATNKFRGNDNVKLELGTGNDLQIYHDGTDSHIQNTNNSGELKIRAHQTDIKNADNNETQAIFHENGAVELYYDNSKKFETSSTGITITGDANWYDNGKAEFGNAADLQIYHNGTFSFIDNDTGNLAINTASGEVQINKDTSEYMARFICDGAVELYYDNSKVLQTHDASGYSGIDVLGDEGGHAVINLKADEGDDGADCWQWTAQTNGASYIKNLSNGSTYEYNIKMIGGGAVELYYDGNKKLETTSGGIKSQVTGQASLVLGSTNAGGAGLFLDGASNGDASGGDYSFIRHNTSGNLEIIANKPSGGSSIDFYANGGNLFMQLTNGGHLIPYVNNASDLGTTSKRWRNIYTNDLNLSNEGGSNDVDGTWGSYTIQEGAEDLFLVNKRNGKKYKFALTEVS